MDEFLNEIWGIHRLYIDKNLLFTPDAEISAVVMSANERNFEKFINIESFKEIFANFGLKAQIYGIQALQTGIINALIKHKISKFSLILNLQTLKEAKIINEAELSKIVSFIQTLNDGEERKDKDFSALSFTFGKNLETLNKCADELITLAPQSAENIKKSKKSANENEFVISVTGVINAGKSSMLNAFLNAPVLGTSNIPETANLTLLKFSKTPYAKVKFYTPDEMKILGFHENYSDIEISPDELINYTSAKNEISKFIKMVELGVEAGILKDNIKIVDTPGLDDAVVLREELTKSFMGQSDAIIHLMNAAQSSTKKDMSFIVETLANSKNSELIIVLTHADMLSKEDLLDALKYAQKSIKEELENFGFSQDLSSNVNFFCIDSISKNGINDLKNFLYESFFGANSKKANAILNSYAKNLALVCDVALKECEFKSLNLLGNKNELKVQNAEILEKIEVLKQDLEELQVLLAEIKTKFDYSDFYDFSALKSAGIIIKDRIISDMKYAKKYRENLDLNRLKIIAQSGINDAITDIFRTFSQRISKDIQNYKMILGEKFGEISNFSFDTQKFMNESFKKPNFTGFDIKFTELINKFGDLVKFSSEFDKFFAAFLKDLNLKNEFEKIAVSCTDNFLQSINENFKTEKNELDAKEKILNEALLQSGINDENIGLQRKNLKEKIEKLNAVKERILKCF